MITNSLLKAKTNDSEANKKNRTTNLTLESRLIVPRRRNESTKEVQSQPYFKKAIQRISGPKIKRQFLIERTPTSSSRQNIDLSNSKHIFRTIAERNDSSFSKKTFSNKKKNESSEFRDNESIINLKFFPKQKRIMNINLYKKKLKKKNMKVSIVEHENLGFLNSMNQTHHTETTLDHNTNYTTFEKQNKKNPFDIHKSSPQKKPSLQNTLLSKPPILSQKSLQEIDAKNRFKKMSQRWDMNQISIQKNFKNIESINKDTTNSLISQKKNLLANISRVEFDNRNDYELQTKLKSELKSANIARIEDQHIKNLSTQKKLNNFILRTFYFTENPSRNNKNSLISKDNYRISEKVLNKLNEDKKKQNDIIDSEDDISSKGENSQRTKQRINQYAEKQANLILHMDGNYNFLRKNFNRKEEMKLDRLFNIQDLNRVIRLNNINKHRIDFESDFLKIKKIKAFKETLKKISEDKMKVLKKKENLPSLVKNKFKRQTIEKFNMYKGVYFGGSRK